MTDISPDFRKVSDGDDATGRRSVWRNVAFARRAVAVLLLVAANSAVAPAQAPPRLIDVQYENKAKMIHPLATHVLPDNVANGADSFRIGILGADPFNGEDANRRRVNFLDAMVQEKKTCKGKPITVHRFASARDYMPCHVLFVSRKSAENSMEKSAEERLAAILAMGIPRPVLIMADSPGLAAKGAAINFVMGVDAAGVPKVRFELNRDAVKRDDLQFSPQFLRMASALH